MVTLILLGEDELELDELELEPELLPEPEEESPPVVPPPPKLNPPPKAKLLPPEPP